jgi:hypothetical protein
MSEIIEHDGPRHGPVNQMAPREEDPDCEMRQSIDGYILRQASLRNASISNSYAHFLTSDVTDAGAAPLAFRKLPFMLSERSITQSLRDTSVSDSIMDLRMVIRHFRSIILIDLFSTASPRPQRYHPLLLVDEYRTVPARPRSLPSARPMADPDG